MEAWEGLSGLSPSAAHGLAITMPLVVAQADVLVRDFYPWSRSYDGCVYVIGVRLHPALLD